MVLYAPLSALLPRVPVEATDSATATDTVTDSDTAIRLRLPGYAVTGGLGKKVPRLGVRRGTG